MAMEPGQYWGIFKFGMGILKSASSHGGPFPSLGLRRAECAGLASGWPAWVVRGCGPGPWGTDCPWRLGRAR